ncbi:glycosyltransferase [Candidatus Parabeggiatoa sp. HSG14]|uniref:glycosyltransferase family 2 protein n=1 Tax=Candidatus Parabeggiatoa sp. HSG14 TaxID=3055593 RepID=UPI0025A89F24|nr:glycosyltransferase [Thiotrichales bacterium HSG14]
MLKYFLNSWYKFSERKSKKVNLYIPTEVDLRRWACSEWIEYQAWLFHYGFLTLYDWQQLRNNALSWQSRPLISIVSPVFNTHPTHLRECIYSVQTQAYPNWEMCLVDDGSDSPATIECLQALIAEDPRLHLHCSPSNQGICHATNKALAMARGEYIAFLDHDDRLAPDALYHVVETIRNHSDTHIIYSDRDSLSPQGTRFMHLFKPNWSPETLLSGNYLFHLVVYRRDLLEQLGGVRVGLEGSQDYDLILRATDKELQVQHIPKVLYHWRQHKQSVSMEQNAKEYVYTAGMQALQETLERRGLKGNINENNELWRGHYQIHLLPSTNSYQVLCLSTSHNYAVQINQTFEGNTNIDYLVILGANVQATNEALTELISWLRITAVGMVTGKVLDKQGHLLHAGLVQRPNGIPLSVYAGFPENTPGYMAVTTIVRNVSSPHPACCVIKRNLWQRLGGLNIDYCGYHALLDFSLRSLNSGTRIVYTPFARFVANDWQPSDEWPETDRQRFVEQWATWLNQGDPYYNPYLTLEMVDMGLNLC